MSDNITLNGELMFPSDYFGAVDLKGKDVTVVIERVSRAELRNPRGGKQRKSLIFFKGTEKKFVCNITNARTIAGLHGGRAEDWIGKRITLYPSRCQGAEGKPVDCIRIRDQAPAPTQAAPVSESPPEEQAGQTGFAKQGQFADVQV